MGIRYFLIPLVISIAFGVAYAQPDHIGVQLSKTCKIMVTNDIVGCPSYKEILALHPDNSNKIISGDFTESEDGFYERQKGMAKRNHFKYYDYHEGVIMWIDPPGDVPRFAKMVIIESSLTKYKIGGQTLDNYTLAFGHQRWTNPNCTESMISAKNWVFLLGDTINYMKHNCNEQYTNFDPIKYETFEKTIHDITTSYKWKLDHWLAQAKINCKELC